jgi:hypothetical protein
VNIFNQLAQAPRSFISPSSTYNAHRAQLGGTQTKLGPSRLVTRDLGTQMAFVLAFGELITFLAQMSFLGLLSIFKSIDMLGLGALPMGQSLPRCPFP